MRFRETRPADYEASFPLVRDAFVYDDASRNLLFSLWDEIIRGRRGESSVVEDERRPPGSSIVSFGLSAFVTDEFLQEVKAHPVPYLSRRVFDRWREGRSPILTFEEVCRANSGQGLNLMVMHYGWAEDELNLIEFRNVQHLLVEAFFDQHRGYQCNVHFQEVFEESVSEGMLGAGFMLHTDYSEAFRTGCLPSPPAGRHPHFVIVTRDDALRRGYNPGLLHFFNYIPPRFHFGGAGQNLLRHAALGQTDEELSRTLRVSLVTVKKRWEAIYARVADVEPNLLPGTSRTLGGRAARGAEKRRHLLAYLRDHPEELKPHRNAFEAPGVRRQAQQTDTLPDGRLPRSATGPMANVSGE